MMNKNQGFTLIELMIVVAIIGILAMFAMPYYKSYIAKTRMAEILNVIADYKLQAIEQYSNAGKCVATRSPAGAQVHRYVDSVLVGPPTNNGIYTSKVTVGDKQYNTVCVINITMTPEGSEIFATDTRGALKVKTLYVNLADTEGNFVWGCAAMTHIGPIPALPNCRIVANIPNTP